MLAEGYLATDPDGTEDEVRDVVSSNLCRCTGYQGIVAAVAETASARRAARLASPTGE
jgi:carbon-monoxide dehydrogenase small subunit